MKIAIIIKRIKFQKKIRKSTNKNKWKSKNKKNSIKNKSKEHKEERKEINTKIFNPNEIFSIENINKRKGKTNDNEMNNENL